MTHTKLKTICLNEKLYALIGGKPINRVDEIITQLHPMNEVTLKYKDNGYIEVMYKDGTGMIKCPNELGAFLVANKAYTHTCAKESILNDFYDIHPSKLAYLFNCRIRETIEYIERKVKEFDEEIMKELERETRLREYDQDIVFSFSE